MTNAHDILLAEWWKWARKAYPRRAPIEFLVRNYESWVAQHRPEFHEFAMAPGVAIRLAKFLARNTRARRVVVTRQGKAYRGLDFRG